MLHIFRRNGTRDDAPIEGGDASIAVSHILTKFLKRLRHLEKPRLLDLGRLSGSNIEFFAQRGCRVQVEDLLLALEDDAPDEDPASTTASPDDQEASGGIAVATDAPMALRTPGPAPAAAAPQSGGAPPAAPPRRVVTASDAGALTRRPGARPTRRIVLPPRTFASHASRPDQPARPERLLSRSAPGITVKNALLPTTFSYPDETFDALVAWDIFNYYDPGPMTLLAAEARRVLKPGGLLLGYFHARRPEGPQTPGRYRILDEGRVACERPSGPLLRRQVYQNRDIEKMFIGLSIVELYFLKNATRELLMEKKAARPAAPPRPVKSEPPRPRFTIE